MIVGDVLSERVAGRVARAVMLRHVSLVYDTEAPIYPPELAQLQSMYLICNESTYRFIRQSSWSVDMSEKDLIVTCLQQQASTGEFITTGDDISFCLDLELREWKYMDEWGCGDEGFGLPLGWIVKYYRLMGLIGAEIGYLV